ncbi:allantoinase [Skermanella stibiiresistens SB22]|uniref:allantoinase n=1 Tax=Skermanella stibiiresistens SB22 TaxID=1385369 RepID=W9HD02_9PROT|nr:allantoinase AllB [Skermanella stibiiresistens]EWY42587.1 allantoinase [Skermanella stibiiresistens SB22]
MEPNRTPTPASSPVDLVITGGTIVTDQTSFKGAVAIRDGKVVAVGSDDTMPEARETFDATGLHLLPGAIDAHVHYREPGYTHKEDWRTGTAAAAMGGVTTVFEMPNTNPPTATVEALRLKQKAAEKAYVDFGLYGLLAEDNLDQLEALIEGGVAAFKCFMGNTFGNLPSPSTGAMLEGFEIIARHGLRISLHAETASIMALRQKKLMEAGRTDPLAHLASRPAVVATEAVSRAAVLAEWTGARIHILHISSGDELRPLRDAKARGVDITGETCPHYLLFDENAYTDLGPIIRVNPPVREKHHQRALWEGLKDGTIDMIATDHAPHDPEEKTREVIWRADCGFPGVETQMALMLTQVNAGSLSLTDYVRLSSTAPAKAFGLFPHKGALVPGSDADIAIVDLGRRETIRAEALHSRGKITPFEGFEVVGVPVHTLVRGRFVMRDRKLIEEATGWGLSVTRVQAMPKPEPRHVDETTAAITGGKSGQAGSSTQEAA